MEEGRFRYRWLYGFSILSFRDFFKGVSRRKGFDFLYFFDIRRVMGRGIRWFWCFI